jgi:Flp pilus assembly protein TadB
MIAAALILVITTAGWFAMPKIMLLVSGGGPLVGAAVAILFMLSFFAVLWLRARYQRNKEDENG